VVKQDLIVFLEYINSQNSPSNRKKLEYCFSAAVLEYLFRAKEAEEISRYWFKRYSREEIEILEHIKKEYGSMNRRPITQRFMQEIILGQHEDFIYDISELLEEFYNEMFKKNKSPIIKGNNGR